MTENIKLPDAVKCAKESDEQAMMDLLRLNWEENGMAPLDENEVLGLLRRGIRRDQAIVGVIRGPQRIEASIGLFIGKWWYTTPGNQHLEDLWCFVHPDHRRTTHAKDLLAFSKWASYILGVPLLMGVLSNERTAPKVRLYQRSLGTPAGAIFVIGKKAS